MGVLLTLVATVLTFIIGIPGMVYSAFRLMKKANVKTWWRALNHDLHEYAKALDRAGNVLCRIPLDQTCRKKMGYPFGSGLETVSFALAMNEKSGTLTRFGRFVVHVLELLDPGHMEKAIEGRETELMEQVLTGEPELHRNQYRP